MHDPTWPPLACTRCGGDLYIELIDEGSAWQSYRVVDSISCEKCGAEWDRNGKPKAVAWLAETEAERPRPEVCPMCGLRPAIWNGTAQGWDPCGECLREAEQPPLVDWKEAE